MGKHDGLMLSLIENETECGSALLMTQSQERMTFMGTIDTPDLIMFLETMFRSSPGLTGIFEEALERAQCPVS